MKAIFARAPVLAWLLTALACFVAGMAVVEASHQAVAFPALTPPDVVVTVEVGFPPMVTPEPSARPTDPRTLTPTPWPTGSAISPRAEDCVYMVCADSSTPVATGDDISPRPGSQGHVR
jgi:hypothetical protein